MVTWSSCEWPAILQVAGQIKLLLLLSPQVQGMADSGHVVVQPLPHHCLADSAAGLPQPRLAPKGQSPGKGTATKGRERGKRGGACVCVCVLRKENPKRILIVEPFYCEGGKTP